MKIDAVLSVNQIKQEEIYNKTVIVIDSLRATSSILTVLHQGCTHVIAVETVGQALQFDDQENIILIGERYCKKINGFHYGNSPITLSQIDLHDQKVVITTTNGTKVLQKVKKNASTVLVGCFLNAAHCMKQAIKLKRDIIFICAGRQGNFAIEDGLTAGLMIHNLRQQCKQVECSDISLMLEQSFCSKEDQLMEVIKQGETGRRLMQTGQEDDLHYCLQLNQYELTGVLVDDEIVPFEVH